MGMYAPLDGAKFDAFLGMWTITDMSWRMHGHGSLACGIVAFP